MTKTKILALHVALSPFWLPPSLSIIIAFFLFYFSLSFVFYTIFLAGGQAPQVPLVAQLWDSNFSKEMTFRTDTNFTRLRMCSGARKASSNIGKFHSLSCFIESSSLDCSSSLMNSPDGDSSNVGGGTDVFNDGASCRTPASVVSGGWSANVTRFPAEELLLDGPVCVDESDTLLSWEKLP